MSSAILAGNQFGKRRVRPEISGTIAAGKDASAVGEQNHAFRKLPGAKLVQSMRSIQIALSGKNMLG